MSRLAQAANGRLPHVASAADHKYTLLPIYGLGYSSN